MTQKQAYGWMLIVAIFVINQIAERVFTIRIQLLFSYLDDLLALPILLGMYQLFIQKIKNDFTVTWYMTVTAVIMLSVHFEVIMPLIHQKYTADIFDVLMYILGAVCFHLLFKRKKKKLQYLL